MTEIVDEQDLVESASLVAITVSVPASGGAVYSPDAVMVPKEAFQVTALSATVPCTLAVNCKVPPVVAEVEIGHTVTEFTVGVGVGVGVGLGVGAERAVTRTVAEADLAVSAKLVAVTMSVMDLDGAV